MNKKIILPIALTILLLGIVFVSASMTGTIDNNKGNYNIEVSLNKGWNLILAGPLLGSDYNVISSNSDIQKKDIKAIYYYFRVGNQYLQMYPNRDETDGYLRNAREKPEETIYFMQSPVWVYSDKEGVLRYSKTDLPSLENIHLSTGWNFVTFTPEISGKSVNQIKGDCNIEDAYLWNVQSQTWSNEISSKMKGEEASLDKPFPQTFEGQGFIIKVKDECKFGEPQTNIEPPPVVPN